MAKVNPKQLASRRSKLRERSNQADQSALDKITKDKLPDYAVGQDIIPISHDSIIKHPLNRLGGLNDGKLDELMSAIKEMGGQMMPGLVRPVEIDGQTKYELIVGHRREEATCRLDMPFIAVVKAMSDAEAMQYLFMDNDAHDKLTFLDKAYACQKMHDTMDMSMDAIGKAVGSSRQVVSIMLKFFTFPNAYLQKLKECESLTFSHVKAIDKALNGDNDAVAQEIITQIADEGMTGYAALKLLDTNKSTKGQGADTESEENISQPVKKNTYTLWESQDSPDKATVTKKGERNMQVNIKASPDILAKVEDAVKAVLAA